MHLIVALSSICMHFKYEFYILYVCLSLSGIMLFKCFLALCIKMLSGRSTFPKSGLRGGGGGVGRGLSVLLLEFSTKKFSI